MDKKSKDLLLQYKGFLETPFLWYGKGVFDFIQFENLNTKTTSFNSQITQKLRLGKLVERFVSFYLQQNHNIKILTENLQIQDQKRTTGELDCILLKKGKPIHLEIIYKFYLYDSNVGNTEIEHWIGPNRRDSLHQKLTKLKEKQLPLLYSKECATYLQDLNLSAHEIEQQIYFKAQLFTHLKSYNKDEFPIINNECIAGFYIHANELEQFKDSKFYIPNKHNWLVVPHTNINWLNFDDFTSKLQIYLDEENAPLCWLKKPNGELFKFFVVWW
ncbi:MULTISPECIES: DUF1853 family protein [unclassified Tenacibaculum]|uniref:DUF1853 family protein n=1 Tax=unclassified Tenacibaculum TaxID=2635139 RepID=UPI001F3FCAC5|nr:MULTISPECIES: DUF1853 family protein [unclassified Tenacibaculum]MCF2874239.1 DUF1853 family protein [Tenacibaculum sp. Cn5-1]MCF2934820.1 DUF1853 family protein [Tenacibaculum sp. Cn5-34]MCG7511030.1 DUF1853 family protein [Tenacibaculum sp. Cn5-46]